MKRVILLLKRCDYIHTKCALLLALGAWLSIVYYILCHYEIVELAEHWNYPR